MLGYLTQYKTYLTYFTERSHTIPVPVPAAPPPALLGSCRLTVAVLCFVAIFQFMIQRFNISMAIVCMTKSTTASDNSDGQSGNNNTDSVGGPEFQWDKDIQTSVLGAFYIGMYSITTDQIQPTPDRN